MYLPAGFKEGRLDILHEAICRVGLAMLGKWKMSQNRPALGSTGVAAGLSVSPDAMDQEVALLVSP